MPKSENTQDPKLLPYVQKAIDILQQSDQNPRTLERAKILKAFYRRDNLPSAAMFMSTEGPIEKHRVHQWDDILKTGGFAELIKYENQSLQKPLINPLLYILKKIDELVPYGMHWRTIGRANIVSRLMMGSDSIEVIAATSDMSTPNALKWKAVYDRDGIEGLIAKEGYPFAEKSKEETSYDETIAETLDLQVKALPDPTKFRKTVARANAVSSFLSGEGNMDEIAYQRGFNQSDVLDWTNRYRTGGFKYLKLLEVQQIHQVMASGLEDTRAMELGGLAVAVNSGNRSGTKRTREIEQNQKMPAKSLRPS